MAIPTGRRLAFALVLFGLVLATIDGVAQVLYFTRYGALYDRESLQRHLGKASDPQAQPVELADIAQRRILHPYLGYAFDRAETMGAGGDVHPLQQRSPQRFVVAVTGGSVANQVRSVLGEALAAAFAARGIEREPVVVGLAVDGFKQPQQLASVAFFVSLGAEYDAVVNIDGFNDIVLPVVDNYERGVYPFYPRSWDSFVNRRPSQATLLGAGEIAVHRHKQQNWMRHAQSWFGHSAIVGLFVAQQLERSTARIASLQAALLAERSELPFEARGPFERASDVAEIYDAAAELWARSSILMHHLLAGTRTAYVHVLQPNQYVEGSKRLTPEEREIAVDPRHPYAPVATRGYPYLFESAHEIRDAGVRYLDATGVFAGTRERVYSDACCHVNRFGKRLLADHVAAFLIETIDEASP